MSADLHGEEAERTVPPAVKGVLIAIRESGHPVAVRRSARTGSWYYRVNDRAEVRGGKLCRQYDAGLFSPR